MRYDESRYTDPCCGYDTSTNQKHQKPQGKIRGSDMKTLEQKRKLKVITFNLNTWQNRKKKLSNQKILDWVMKTLSPDVMILTEAAIPVPQSLIDAGWSVVHREGGVPGRSGWGTVIAVRSPLNIRHITTAGIRAAHKLDTNFPGHLTAADITLGDEYIATAVGLHLRCRTDKNGKFIGATEYDLYEMKPDFQHLYNGGERRLIVAGDFNYSFLSMPYALWDLNLVDPFSTLYPYTFQQFGPKSQPAKLDYIIVDRHLGNKIVERKGGFKDFPTSRSVSDHAPLSVTIDLDLDVLSCSCGSKLRRPADSFASQLRCPKCNEVQRLAA